MAATLLGYSEGTKLLSEWHKNGENFCLCLFGIWHRLSLFLPNSRKRDAVFRILTRQVKEGWPLFSHESDILRKLRLLEALKADIVINVGQLYHAVARNSEQAIREGLADVILSCYVLARRLGIDFSILDETISSKIMQNIKREHEAEKLFGDFSAYQRYLRKKRGD